MKIFAVYVSLLAAFFITACGDVEARKHFDSRLDGTWVSNDKTAIYSGILKISYDRIIINGYGEGQTPPPLEGGDDNKRPFKNFTKGIALKGYSEEGKFFINDGGLVQEGIPYVYWDDEFPSYYKKIKLLRFTFGGRVETLEWRHDEPVTEIPW